MGYIIAQLLAASIQAFQVKEAVVNMSKESTVGIIISTKNQTYAIPQLQ